MQKKWWDFFINNIFFIPPDCHPQQRQVAIGVMEQGGGLHCLWRRERSAESPEVGDADR